MSAGECIRDILAGYVAGLAGRDIWLEQVAGQRQYSNAFCLGYTQGTAKRIAADLPPVSANALFRAIAGRAKRRSV